MRNGFRIVDTDCHHIEPPGMWAEYIDHRYADQAPAPGDVGRGRDVMMVEGQSITRQDGNYPMDTKEFRDAVSTGMQKFAPAMARGFDPVSRLADMEEEGVDAQVIYPTVGGQLLGKPFKDPELLAACCKAYNDWSLEYCSEAPDKLMMAAMLPMQFPDFAVEEANRVSEKGLPVSIYVRILWWGVISIMKNWSRFGRYWRTWPNLSASMIPALHGCLRLVTACTRIRQVISLPIPLKRWWR